MTAAAGISSDTIKAGWAHIDECWTAAYQDAAVAKLTTGAIACNTVPDTDDDGNELEDMTDNASTAEEALSAIDKIMTDYMQTLSAAAVPASTNAAPN